LGEFVSQSQNALFIACDVETELEHVGNAETEKQT
jgi:hypothetical protein